MRKSLIFCLICVFYSCNRATDLPVIEPRVITERTPHDTDDPAIWYNRDSPENSLVFGTDKNELTGGVYAFSLDGKIIAEKSLTAVNYPNNVDIEYGFKLNDSTNVDILMFTERESHRVRLYAIPEMKPLDNGGFSVFVDEDNKKYRRPMGIAIYKDPHSESVSFVVSRKEGPLTDYLYQYALISDGNNVEARLVRKFGAFSGEKEIEAIAVDDLLGYVYYSDEGAGIRKYYADLSKGNQELSLFGKDHFTEDMEGICLVDQGKGKGYIVISDQQDHSFNVFDRNDNSFVKKLNLGTVETDGCEAISLSLGEKFPKGLFVSMNDSQNFFFHALEDLELAK